MGISGGGPDNTGDAQPSYLLYFVLCVHSDKQLQLGRSSRSGHNWGAADEADAIGEKLGLAMRD